LTLLLDAAELAPLLDMKQAIAVTRTVFEAQAAGQVAPEPPIFLRLGHNHLRAVVGGVLSQNRVGFRGSVGGGDRAVAVMTLIDTETGEPIAVMGYPFGTLRTGATVGLAADVMAPPGARLLGLIGTGRNALSLLEGIQCVRRIEEVRVYSRNGDNRRAFARRAENVLGIPCLAVDSPEACVAAAEIILTSTNSPTAALQGRWLRSQVHVSSMGRPNELDEDVYRRAERIVVSSKHHEVNYYDRELHQPLLALAAAGEIDWDAVLELGDIVAADGRLSSAGITVFRESQGGFGDTALGAWAYDRARQLGLGREFDFKGAVHSS
jgi:ornithine cyclodeaminase